MENLKCVIAAAKACVCETADSSPIADRNEVENLKALITNAASERVLLKDVLSTTFSDLEQKHEEGGRYTTLLTSTACAALHNEIVLHVIDTLWSNDCLPDEIADTAASALVEAAQSMRNKDAAALIDRVLTVFKDSEQEHGMTCTFLLKLLPIALARTGDDMEADETGSPEADVHASMEDLQENIVSRVCQQSWPKGSIPQVAEMLRELPLKSEQRSAVIERTLQECNKADVVDLPAAVHQLLLLADAQSRSAVLSGLLKLYARRVRAAQSPQAARLVTEVAGTILLEIELTVNYHPDIGRAWLATLKAQHSMSAFGMAISLILAGMQRFADAARDMLKKMILSAYVSDERRQASSWAAGLPADPCSDGTSLASALLDAVRNATCGWDRVLQPAVQLASALMDNVPRRSGAHEADPMAKGASLGEQVMLAAFEVSPHARAEILDLAQSRVVGVRPEAAAPYVCLINSLVAKFLAQLAEHAARMKGLLDLFPLMSPGVALGLLVALSPACAARNELKDAAILVLRKSMFARDVGGRLLAVHGFLYMIVRELEGRTPDLAYASEPSSSQASLSQLSALASGSAGVTLLQELTGFLRRSLSQQAAVRETLYKGIPKILAADPTATEALAGLLLPHLQQFTDDALPPLRLEACACLQAEQAHMVEPLHVLVACVRQVLHHDANLAREGSGTEDQPGRLGLAGTSSGSATSALRECFMSVRTRMLECNLEDFGLDGLTEFAPSVPQGMVNQMTAGMLLGSLEVLMEDIVEDARRDRTQASGNHLNKLFSLHDRLHELVLAKQAKKPGQAGMAGPSQAAGQKRGHLPPSGHLAVPEPSPTLLDKRHPAFTNACITRLLDAVVDDGVVPASQLVEGEDAEAGPSTLPSHTKLARNARFQAFVLRSTLKGLQSGKRPTDAIPGLDGLSSEPLASCKEVGQALFRAVQIVILACSDEPRGTGAKKDKNPRDILVPLAVQCLHELVRQIKSCTALAQLLQGVGPALPDSTPAETVPIPECAGEAEVAVLQRLPHLNHMLSRILAQGHWKEAELLAECLAHVALLLPPNARAVVSGWGRAACANDSCEEPTVKQGKTVKALISLYLNFAGGDDIAAMKEVVDEASPFLKGEDDPPTSEILPIINIKTAASAAVALLAYVETSLQEVEWVLTTLRNTRAIGGRAASQRIAVEDAAFARVLALTEPVDSCLDPCVVHTSANEHLVRILVQTYRALTSATVLVTAPKGVTQAIPSRAFQAMVEEVNKHLTVHVYDFVLPNLQPDENQAPNSQQGAGRDATRKGPRRDGRNIPGLIFAIEEFEKHLIVLSSNCRVNFMRLAKKSQARDFKIDTHAARVRAPPTVAVQPIRQDAGGEVADQEGDDDEDEGDVEEVGDGENVDEDGESEDGEDVDEREVDDSPARRRRRS